MPLEPIWRYFFDAFPFDWEQYFSVYIHFPPNFKGLEPSSIFAGHEIQNPVNVVWGQHSMVRLLKPMLGQQTMTGSLSGKTLLCIFSYSIIELKYTFNIYSV